MCRYLLLCFQNRNTSTVRLSPSPVFTLLSIFYIIHFNSFSFRHPQIPVTLSPTSTLSTGVFSEQHLYYESVSSLTAFPRDVYVPPLRVRLPCRLRESSVRRRTIQIPNRFFDHNDLVSFVHLLFHFLDYTHSHVTSPFPLGIPKV